MKLVEDNFISFFSLLKSYKEKNHNLSPLLMTFIRDHGQVFQYSFPYSNTQALPLLERVVKFLLWSQGAHTLLLDGSDELVSYFSQLYSSSGKRAFDAMMMEKVYGTPFQVKKSSERVVNCSSFAKIGGHFGGARIGFDLGASDVKISAVLDGQVVFDDELLWDPVTATDCHYHYDFLNAALKKAAASLPRVDAIGGSSAGIIIENEFKVASLFRGLSESDFNQYGRHLIKRLEREWKVPFCCINDGDVTALAGSLSLEHRGVLGVAMGSSEAAGYINQAGFVTGALTELAFAPIDLNIEAALDEWSKDIGLGAQTFSQQGVDRLARLSGYEFQEEIPLKERLKLVQTDAAKGDERALSVFKTIGNRLAHTIPLYREFYSFSHLLILGRVTSSVGGELIINEANHILKTEYPELKEQVQIQMPDERMRRTGQAKAAASLVELKK